MTLFSGEKQVRAGGRFVSNLLQRIALGVKRGVRLLKVLREEDSPRQYASDEDNASQARQGEAYVLMTSMDGDDDAVSRCLVQSWSLGKDGRQSHVSI